MLTQQAIKKQKKGTVEVLVDSGTARENVSRIGKKCRLGSELRGAGQKAVTRIVLTEMIYLDNAATSWPKPPEVLQGNDRCPGARRGQPRPLRAPVVH